MRRYYYILILFTALTCASNAQETPAVFESFSETVSAEQAADAGANTPKLPLEEYDSADIVPVPAESAQPAAQTDPAQQAADQPKKKKRKEDFRLVGAGKELEEDETEILPGTLAVYIDIEEAFNKNPWTLQARRNLRLDLETRQIEYAQLQQHVKELKAKEVNLEEELAYYKSYYEKPEYIEAQGTNIYPRLTSDDMYNVLSTLVFSSSDQRRNSPENTPQKLEQIKANIRDTKKAIIEKEAYLLSYKEFSKEDVLSRQDYIVQEILKEIYSGIKEFAAVRNIGIVVDKKDLIYGKPLSVTAEFVKWMKTYHKKYVKQNGEIL
jgi:hypothetical protein